MSNEATKPTIETLLERLTAFQSAMENRFQKLESKLGVLNDTILDLRSDIRLLMEERSK